MLFYLVLCNILFLPIIYSNATTSVENKVANSTDKSTSSTKNETKIKLVSEGGSEITIQDLPVSHQTALDLNIEAGRNKESSSKPRKGANLSDYYSVENGITTSHDDSSLTAKKIPDNTSVSKQPPINTVDNLNIHLNKTTLTNNVPGADKVVQTIPKKPLKVVYETLENYANKISPETLANSESTPKDIKKYAVTNTNSHPGMVMPIVITILLVPMFAVLGFMAIRSGKEAWKNRHYKRMDFLLDGMYND